MNIREQFGKYLLLKKLAEDALGETFRAGRVGSHGMEQVVLLRVFNGPGVDAASLTASLDARREVQKALVSPNVGNGVDLGNVRGVPFVAYDYISGKDLASLQEQAKRRNHPIPSDHALLIAERIALALAVGYETRLGDDRVLHGAALPQLVMISNEGETRLLGFEAAPGLRQVLRTSPSARALARYLSPEARGGAPAHKSDDVFAVGAILYELLTGKALPAESDLAGVVDSAELAAEGTPLPEDLKRLLKQSLTTQDKRVADVVTWHKQLSRMMFEGSYNPTTFNLAFFMHNLFRDEIEKESREIEVEKTMALPAAAVAAASAAAGARPVAPAAAPAAPAAAAPVAAAPPAPAPVADLREATGVRADSAVFRSTYGVEPKGGKSKLVAGAIAALVLVGVAVGFYLLAGKAPDGATSAAAAPPPASAPAAVPAANTAALQQQAAAQQAEAQRLEELYREMMEKQSKELEERYRAQFDSELDSLRKDLDAAKQRAADAQAAAAAPPPAPRREPAPARDTVATPPPRVASTPATAPQPAATAAAPAAPAPAPVQEVAAAQPAVPAPAPATPTVNRGDLVTPGPGVVMPRIQVRPRPTYPAAARSARKEATVVVRVLIDENGRVDDAELKSKEVGFGLDREALRAARTARYAPATKDGVPVKMWLELPIDFRL